ncbi:hypothetical protein A2Z22_02915 [Candidatus Woesebacteria bacterium RBG_16_34_12]|uniref:Uncharacterized protein n=1 Tax=Candidatus Woesebacteria bacterium RBG_16_34_12 TaxID=1802480 RepID=A0A1F7X6V8_9BACT|nr:MAG: hypothetical protein A2Z22_02915 [Candidatus Woesebacteria bacterium RBG_16_34_12]
MNKIKLIKRLILILISLTVIFSIGIVIKNVYKEPEPQISQEVVPTPGIPKLYEGTLPIKLEVSSKDVQIPTKASVLKIEANPINQELAIKIANNLGFKQLPTEINDVTVGKKLFWKNENSYLSITLDIGEIYYGLHFIPKTINKQLNDNNIIQIAQNYLNSNFPDFSESFKVSLVTPLKSTDNLQGSSVKTNKENADYFEVDLLPKDSVFEIITLVPNQSPYAVGVLPDGNIFYIRLTNIKTSGYSQEYELKDFEEIRRSLNEALLVNIEGSYLPVSEIQTSSIQEIVINEIKIAYLWESSKNTIFQPVFLLKGPIKIDELKDVSNAQLYLSAIKHP